MANPQTENGYTKIANEIIENMVLCKFNGSQYALILIILRYTYGYNRKTQRLGLKFLSNAIRIDKKDVKTEIDKLIDANVIIIFNEETYKDSREIGINKDYENWKIEKRKVKNIKEGGKNPTGEGGKKTPPSLNAKKPLKTSNTNNLNECMHLLGGGVITPPIKKDKRNIKKNIKKGENFVFEKLWILYPRKIGKDKINFEKFERELNILGFDKFARCIERYKKDKPDWQAWQNGSTFFNSGYKDYIADDYIKQEDGKKNKSYNNFEQREYTEAELEKFYVDVTEEVKTDVIKKDSN